MPTIPFNLITGFLGSGKTTFLKRILDAHADGRKIGVIQNEFAPANIDGRELRATGKPFELLEINNGSVFCVCLLSDFVRSLGAFIDAHAPDAIILEATGLADPIAVAQILGADTLRARLYLAHIWCIVDAPHFLRMEQTVGRISHQVRIADTVAINKIDLAVSSRGTIAARIKQLNPFARVIESTYCNFPCSELFVPPRSKPVAMTSMGEHEKCESGGRPDIVSVVVKTTTPVSQKNLGSFLERYAPKTYRIKGYASLINGSAVMIQSCFGTVEMRDIGPLNGPSEIVAMGAGLDAGIMQKDFERLCVASQ